MDSEQKANLSTIENLKHKYKAKTKLLKNKIMKQKEELEQKSKDLVETNRMFEEAKDLYKMTIESLQKDMKKVRDEWENKCTELEREGSRMIAEQQSEYDIHFTQLQTDFENKVNQIESDARSQLQQSNLFEEDLQRKNEEKLEILEKSYIKISEYEYLLCQQLNDQAQKHIENLKQMQTSYEKEFANQKITHERKIIVL